MKTTTRRSQTTTDGLGRVLVAVVITLGVVLWMVAGLDPSDAAEAGGEGGGEQVVVIAEGDTLWEVASPFAPAGMDRQVWLGEVAERNNVDPRDLRPGDALRIPRID